MRYNIETHKRRNIMSTENTNNSKFLSRFIKTVLVAFFLALISFGFKYYTYKNDSNLIKRSNNIELIKQRNKKILAEQEIILKQQEQMIAVLKNRKKELDKTLEKLDKMKQSKNIEKARLFNLMSQINQSYALKN